MAGYSGKPLAAKLGIKAPEDAVREVALALGLVDIKVCAVDDTWSGRTE